LFPAWCQLDVNTSSSGDHDLIIWNGELARPEKRQKVLGIMMVQYFVMMHRRWITILRMIIENRHRVPPSCPSLFAKRIWVDKHQLTQATTREPEEHSNLSKMYRMGNVAFISNKNMTAAGSRGTSERERPFVRRIHRRTIKKKHFVVIMIEFVENGNERYIKVEENRLKNYPPKGYSGKL